MSVDLEKSVDEAEKLRGAATRAAELIWDDLPAGKLVVDPRNSVFADQFISESARHLGAAKGLLRRALEGASRGAEGTNVEAFHGLVEIIQNADDLHADEVRLMLRGPADNRQMLVVHNGEPVTCHHVPGMMLPYVTTKEDDPDQRGRFGIGLKTLRRISSKMTVHSAPYHFHGGQGVSIAAADAEPCLGGFYDPSTDTMVVLDLTEEFDEARFDRWFSEWPDDSLIFLDHVRSFRRCDSQGTTTSARTTAAGAWLAVERRSDDSHIERVERRSISAAGQSWTVTRIHVRTPPDRQRAHKRTSQTTPISIAFNDQDEHHGLFIGFRTRVPTSLPFAIDAQFDPSTARESVIENSWNLWIIARCGEALAEAALTALADGVPGAWRLVALTTDRVGDVEDPWPREAFATAFAQAREQVAERARLPEPAGLALLSSFAYEAPPFTGLFDDTDLATLANGALPLSVTYRDPHGRWRRVVEELDVCRRVDGKDVIAGFQRSAFTAKPASWWCDAASRLTAAVEATDLFGVPLWLQDIGEPLACVAKDQTRRVITYGTPPSAFARRWNLFPRLHGHYASPAGERAVAWLNEHAAFRATIDARDELMAFAETHRNTPVALTDDELREVRDMLDPFTGQAARVIGASLGQAILIDAFEYRGGKLVRNQARPVEVYLPKAIDGEHPNWPLAAGELPGIRWAANTYDSRLPTGLGKLRKREDGVIPRGPRKFLSILGAASAPRLVRPDKPPPPTATRTAEVRALGANQVSQDWTSPDLDRVLGAIEAGPKKLAKERRERSAALMRAISRDWPARYAPYVKASAEQVARIHTHPKGDVSAYWICRLRDAAWVAVGGQQFRRPSEAALRNTETQSLYRSEDFVSGIGPDDLDPGFVRTIQLISSVKASHLMVSLKEMRDGAAPMDLQRLRLAYRHLSRLAPKFFHQAFGDTTSGEIKRLFAEGTGLVAVIGDKGVSWRKPEQVLRGRHIFPESERFVLDGDSYAGLWTILGVRQPQIVDCVNHLARHAVIKAPGEDDGVLIELYRYMDDRITKAERPDLERLRGLPLACGGQWVTRRPIFLVADPVLRAGLAKVAWDRKFWDPPCDIQGLAHLIGALRLVTVSPKVRPLGGADAADFGAELSDRFGRAVEHLSDALGRAASDVRRHIAVDWDDLRTLPLFVYEDEVPVEITDDALASFPLKTTVNSFLQRKPLQLHIAVDALEERDEGGRAIASLFAASVRRSIEAEWVTAWHKSEKHEADGLKFRGDDEEHAAKIAEAAAQIAANLGAKVKLTPQRAGKGAAPPRRLKEFQPGISSIEVTAGVAATPPKPPTKPNLAERNPGPGKPPSSTPVANTEYNIGDLEQRGWDMVLHVLSRSDGPELVDFRRRHGVGADGVFDWKSFVELKASGRTEPSSIGLSATEFARAFERRNDYILALASGLEEGAQTQVKLIFDPTRRASIRETTAVRLNGLGEAPGIVVKFADDGTVQSTKEPPA